jgi:hypothetical protein
MRRNASGIGVGWAPIFLRQTYNITMFIPAYVDGEGVQLRAVSRTDYVSAHVH